MNLTDKLSDHITLQEAIVSQTASRLGIDNTPSEDIISNMELWAIKLFEPLRAYVSQVRGVDSPIHISSMYRSSALNTAIGGAKDSQHMQGLAGDLEVYYPDFDKKALFLAIKEKMAFDQLIAEFKTGNLPSWIHVSWSPTNNRHEIFIAAPSPNGTQYLTLDHWDQIYNPQT